MNMGFWEETTLRCERKYEYLIDKLALALDDDNLELTGVESQ